MKSKLPWILGLGFLSLIGLFIIFMFFGLIAFFLSPPETDYSARADLAVIELLGPIRNSSPLVKRLKTIGKNKHLKGVILRIDSPGGIVGASQEIHQAVQNLAKEKLVIASLGSMAASGGYYVAVGANLIVANPGTLTGSIGVRMDYANIQELLKFLKIDAETLKSGKLKDVGSPLRGLSPEDRAFLDSVLKNLHAQFKQAVSEGRNIPMKELEEIADGRILTGEQALEKKLVDHLGNQEEAINLAKKQLNLSEDPDILYPEHRLEAFEGFLGRVLSKTLLDFWSSQKYQAYY